MTVVTDSQRVILPTGQDRTLVTSSRRRLSTHDLTGLPFSFAGAAKDTCREVDESMTDTAPPAGTIDRVTPVPYSSG